MIRYWQPKRNCPTLLILALQRYFTAHDAAEISDLAKYIVSVLNLRLSLLNYARGGLTRLSKECTHLVLFTFHHLRKALGRGFRPRHRIAAYSKRVECWCYALFFCINIPEFRKCSNCNVSVRVELYISKKDTRN